MPSTPRRPARGRTREAGWPPEAVRAQAAAPPLARERQAELLYWLKLDRALETRLANLYKQGKVLGGLFRSLGQEAISVGSAYALGRDDWFAPSIRDMGACLVRGIQPRVLIAQYMARAIPVGGRDNALHFGFLDKGMVSPISPLGGLVSVMAGVALGFRIRGEPRVAMTWSGDGQTSTGSWHEGLNFAAALGLPFVLIVENNGWAYSTPVARQTRVRRFSDKARAYGIPGETVDGNDVLAVYEAALRAIDRARRGEGPTLIEATTFRRLGHSEHDDPRKYVPPEVFEQWAGNDPIDRFETRLIGQQILSRHEIAQLDRRIGQELDAAQAWAESVPQPDPASLTRGVFAED